MKPRSVRVIKKVVLGALSGPEAKTESEPKIDLDRSVGSWITERRENGRLEKVSSDEAISAWKQLPDTT